MIQRDEAESIPGLNQYYKVKDRIRLEPIQ